MPRDGMIAAEGWLETSEISVLDLVRRFEDGGVAAVIFTDISRDGDLSGANHQATCELRRLCLYRLLLRGGWRVLRMWRLRRYCRCPG